MSERKVTIQAIESKQFDIKPRGYDRDEVDTFLDEICDEMERMENELEKLKRDLREARAAAQADAPAQRTKVMAPVAESKSAPAPAPAAPAAATNAELISVLELANRLKDETVAEARKRAEEILSKANEQARERLGNLEDEQVSLSNQVEALKKLVAEYRARFTELLQAQQEAMDKISDL